MPNVPISGLPLTTSVCATALVPIVQNGVTCSTYACLLGSGGGGGGVTQITAGTGVTISPSCGTGNVTICSTAVLPAVGSFTTCVSSPTVCGTTQVLSPLFSGAIHCGTTCIASPLLCGTTSVCTPTLVATNACITGLNTSGCAVCVGTSGLLTAYTPSGGGGGVTSIVQGTGICISPSCGTGAVTICATGGGSSPMVSGIGICSILGNGCSNQASGNFSFIGGGCNNINGTGCSTLVGGICNNISTGNVSFIGGGQFNTICGGSYSSIVGGIQNTIDGNYSSISGGFCSSLSGAYGNIGGGRLNKICNSSNFSFIGSGCSNIVCGSYGSVLGGSANTSLCNYTGVFGCGLCNTQPCTFMANNFVIGNFVGCGGCFVALDANGKMCVTTGSGGGGIITTGSGIYSTMRCGVGNNAAGCNSTVFGNSNSANYISHFGVISGGTCNFNNNLAGFVGGGCNNSLASGIVGVCDGFGAIAGGCRNYIGGSRGFIGGGTCNCITNSCSIIVGGNLNGTGIYPSGAGCNNTIVGGYCNRTSGNNYGGIFTGYCNCNFFTCAVFSAGDAGFAITIGGCCNLNTACFGFIGNGYNNCFQNTFGYNSFGSILNGFGNRICMAQNGAILNGNNNTLGQNYTAVLSGSNNCVQGTSSVVVNGNYNTVSAPYSNLFGCCNNICNASYGTIIGCCNLVCQNSACSVGCITYPFVQGDCNCIFTGLPFYDTPTNAVIFGSCNKICSNSGGGTTNNVFVFGCNLTADNQNTAYFNNICVCGFVYKSGGSFKIPHPDPIKAESGKFLRHSFVESPTAGDNIYRYNVTTSNCSASIDLPDYYNLLNGNDQVYVNAKNHLGYGFGIINNEQTKIDITTNSDGDYNVLLIGTRKDKLASDNWNGVEVEANEIKK